MSRTIVVDTRAFAERPDIPAGTSARRIVTDLRLDHIRATYNGVDVISDVSFSVDDGEMAVLVGPSGSGKTTLLRVITGYAPVTEGTVYVGGRDVTGQRPRDRDIAMVFQNLALYPRMTVRENWEFPLRAVKMSNIDRERRVSRVAETL